ncbi:MAG: amidohydrolase family protein [Candidatus Dormibacteria bacterium]
MSGAVVDAHVHVMPDRVRRETARVAAADPWFAVCHAGDARLAGEADLLGYLDREGIDRAVVFTWPFRDPRLCTEANDFAAELQRRHPDRVVGCGIVQPADPGAAAELRRCARLGLRGIGELNADAQGFALDGDPLARLGALSAELDLPWTLHCSEPVGHAYAGKGTATPDRWVRLAERAAGLRLVAAHLGGGLPFYAHMPEVRDLCATLWFDTAALPHLYRPAALRAVVSLIGADRLLLGTDFPLLGMARYRRALDAAGIDGAERALVLGGSAAAVWRW